jgi:hypothetical protein
MVTAYPNLPPTSAAVNIQIVEPKNFAGGATPGSIGPAGSQQPAWGQQPQPNAYAPNNPYAPSAPQQYGPQQYGLDPQQQLYSAYNDALNARNAAEQARNNYLNVANSLNNQAYYQQQPTFAQQPQQPYFQQTPYYPQQAPFNQSINNVPPQPQQVSYPQPYPYAPNPYEMNPYAQQPQMPYPQQQQPQADPFQQVPQPDFPQPVDQPQQPELQPAQPPQEPGNPFKSATVDDLNMMISSPATLQEKINAMEEVGVRGQGNPQTYEILKREALADTSQLSGQPLDDANYIRQAALWTMGMLNKAQNSSVPTDKLPGLASIEKILSNRRENPEVQSAAVQALQVIDRPNDKRIQKVLKAAAKSKNPDVKRLANEALAGKTIPLPTQQPSMMYMA